MSTHDFPVQNLPTDATRFRLAYERLLPAIEAVPDSDLHPLNVDVPSTVATVLGAHPAIVPYRAALEALPDTDPAALDRVAIMALALLESHTRYETASRPPTPITELVDAATEERNSLHVAAVTLSHYGLFDDDVLEAYRGTVGYKVLVTDLNALCHGFRKRWADIEGKSPVTLAQLDRAEMTNQQLITAIGAREQAPAAIAEAALVRQKAFTLLARTYDEIRRGIHYVRWHEDDANTIAPSLFAGRGGRRRAEEPAPTAAAVMGGMNTPPLASSPKLP